MSALVVQSWRQLPTITEKILFSSWSFVWSKSSSLKRTRSTKERETTMAQKVHSSVVIFTVQLWFFTVQLWFFKQFSYDFSQFNCNFSQFSCDFWSSSVMIFHSSIVIFHSSVEIFHSSVEIFHSSVVIFRLDERDWNLRWLPKVFWPRANWFWNHVMARALKNLRESRAR